jgi:hypothetical protein
MRKLAEVISKTRWLSHAVAELEANTKQPARSPTKSVYSRYLVLRRGIRTDVAAVVFFLASLHITLLLPKVPLLPGEQHMREFVFTLWQVGAATVALALVILLLIVESVQRSAEGDFVWKRFSTDPFFSLAIVFLLSTVATTGIGALLVLPKTDDSLPTPQGLENVVIIDFAIFLAALLLILSLYRTMFRYMSPSYGTFIAREYLLESVRSSVIETIRIRMRGGIMRTECNQVGMSWDEGMTEWPGMTPIQSQADGVVSDVDLTKLSRLPAVLTSTQTPSARIAVGVGATLTKEKSVLALVFPADANDNVASSVSKCFRITPRDE